MATDADMTIALFKLATATTPEARREAFEEMQRIHQGRTEEQVEAMERERGLKR